MITLKRDQRIYRKDSMTTIPVTGNETVACAVLRGTPKANQSAFKNAARLGASRLVVIGDVEQLDATLRTFCLDRSNVEAYPSQTPLPVGVNVVVFDAASSAFGG